MAAIPSARVTARARAGLAMPSDKQQEEVFPLSAGSLAEQRKQEIELRKQEYAVSLRHSAIRELEIKTYSEQAKQSIEEEGKSDERQYHYAMDRNKKAHTQILVLSLLVVVCFTAAVALAPVEDRGGLVQQLFTHAIIALGGFGGGVSYVLLRRK